MGHKDSQRPLENEHSANYQQYLNSEHWLSLRARALKAYPYCRLCGSRLALQVHHLVYRGPWCQTPLGDLFVLCRECHSRVHWLLDTGRLRFTMANRDHVRTLIRAAFWVYFHIDHSCRVRRKQALNVLHRHCLNGFSFDKLNQRCRRKELKRQKRLLRRAAQKQERLPRNVDTATVGLELIEMTPPPHTTRPQLHG